MESTSTATGRNSSSSGFDGDDGGGGDDGDVHDGGVMNGVDSGGRDKEDRRRAAIALNRLWRAYEGIAQRELQLRSGFGGAFHKVCFVMF